MNARKAEAGRGRLNITRLDARTIVVGCDMCGGRHGFEAVRGDIDPSAHFSVLPGGAAAPDGLLCTGCGAALPRAVAFLRQHGYDPGKVPEQVPLDKEEVPPLPAQELPAEEGCDEDLG